MLALLGSGKLDKQRNRIRLAYILIHSNLDVLTWMTNFRPSGPAYPHVLYRIQTTLPTKLVTIFNVILTSGNRKNVL